MLSVFINAFTGDNTSAPVAFECEDNKYQTTFEFEKEAYKNLSSEDRFEADYKDAIKIFDSSNFYRNYALRVYKEDLQNEYEVKHKEKIKQKEMPARRDLNNEDDKILLKNYHDSIKVREHVTIGLNSGQPHFSYEDYANFFKEHISTEVVVTEIGNRLAFDKKTKLALRAVNKEIKDTYKLTVFIDELNDVTLKPDGRFASPDTQIIHGLIEGGNQVVINKFAFRKKENYSRLGWRKFLENGVPIHNILNISMNENSDILVDIGHQLKENHHLETLRLRGWKLGLFSSAGLASIIEKSKNLKNIQMPCVTSFGDHVAFCVAPVLAHSRSLENIELCGSKITDKGVVALAKALEKNQSLNYLHFYNSKIGVQGALALNDALKINSTIGSVWCSDFRDSSNENFIEMKRITQQQEISDRLTL